MNRFIPTLLALLLLPSLAAADRLITIDARTLEGQLASVSTQDAVLLDPQQKKQSVPLAQVSELIFGEPADVMAKASQPVVVMADGGKIAASDITISQNKVVFTNSLLGQASLPLSSVSVIYVPGAGRSAGDIVKIAQAMSLPERGDVLIARRTTKEPPAAPAPAGPRPPKDPAQEYVAVEGVLKGMDAKAITFNYNGADGKVDREKVVAIRLAPVTTQPAPLAGGSLTLAADCGTIHFTALTLGDDQVVLEVPGIGTIKTKRSDLAVIRFFSDRVVDLSSLKPISVKQYGLFDRVFNWQSDLAAGGGPLKLGGQIYSTGVGLHSFSELTWQLGEGYATLVAMAGIDDAYRPSGNARLIILGDGKELQKPLDLTGKTAPVPLRVPVTGVKQLTVRVEFGEDKLDVGDHVDLAAAKLIK